jgi:excisionase family DNA binding protein
MVRTATSIITPIALPPAEAARIIGISKRSLYRLVADNKVVARRDGSRRTLIDVASLRAYFESLPVKVGTGDPLPCSPRGPLAKQRPAFDSATQSYPTGFSPDGDLGQTTRPTAGTRTSATATSRRRISSGLVGVRS